MKGRTKNMVDEPVMPNTVKMMNMSHHLHNIHGAGVRTPYVAY